MEANSNQWWYEMDGEQKGPVGHEEIQKLIRYGSLKKSNLIWKQGLTTWAPLHTTEFNAHFRADVPPPIIGESVNNNIIWLLAFAPLLGKILEGVFLEFTHPRPSAGADFDEYVNYFTKTDFHEFWFVTLALNILLCYVDEKKLKKAGHDTSKLGSAWLVPVYLYKRAEMLKQNNAYFWIWIILFVLSIVGFL